MTTEGLPSAATRGGIGAAERSDGGVPLAKRPPRVASTAGPFCPFGHGSAMLGAAQRWDASLAAAADYTAAAGCGLARLRCTGAALRQDPRETGETLTAPTRVTAWHELMLNDTAKAKGHTAASGPEPAAPTDSGRAREPSMAARAGVSCRAEGGIRPS